MRSRGEREVLQRGIIGSPRHTGPGGEPGAAANDSGLARRVAGVDARRNLAARVEKGRLRIFSKYVLLTWY